MGTKIQIGDEVHWMWGKTSASGVVINIFNSASNHDSQITRDEDANKKPIIGLIIQMDDGRKVLKLENEVQLRRDRSSLQANI